MAKPSPLGKVLIRLQDDGGWDLASIARQMGVDYAGLHRHKTGGAQRAQADTLARLADITGIPLADIVSVVRGSRDVKTLVIPPVGTKLSPREQSPQDEPLPIVSRLYDIPTFATDLSCGPWIADGFTFDVLDPRRHTNVTEAAMARMILQQGLFRVRSKGDSMEPTYPSGSIIEFRVLNFEREGPNVGECYYFQLADERRTFKCLSAIEEDHYILSALNSKKYPKPMKVPIQDVTRMAVAEGVFQPRACLPKAGK